MTTNLTSGTQVNVDPSTLPITWIPGTNYTIRLNPGYVQETGGNHLPSPVQTVTASITTFNTVPSVVQVSPTVGATSIYTSTVAITYNRNIHQSTNTNYYLYSGTNLVATIPGSSTRIRTPSKSSTLTNNQILIDLTGYILPNTHYYVNVDQGVVYDMFNFSSLSASNILDWTSGDGPSIIDYSPSYNTTTNVTSATLKFSKVINLNTGNFYLKNALDTIRTIPVIGSSVSLLNTNTVSINIDNIPTPEDLYHITWDQGIVVDNNSIAIYGVEDSTPLRFYDQMMKGVGSRIYDHTSSSYLFTNTNIVDFNTGSYQLTVSSPYGEFSHLSSGTNGGSYWSMTGTPTQINAAIPTIKFTPSTNYGADTTYHWQLTRDSVPIYDQILDLIGQPYKLPIAQPGDINNVAPNNLATLTLTVGSLGVTYEPFTLTANINSYIDLGGTVQFKVGNTIVGTADMSTAGVASTTTIFSTTGTRVITALWSGGQMPNLFKYDRLTSNTASTYIDIASHLNLSISSTETPEIITNDNVFVATANTSTLITGPVTFGVYNTSTRAFTTVLGTGTFVNNSATITVNSGTLAAGTYTVAAVWTGSNVIPKYYGNTATMLQVYGDKGPTTINVYTATFYWHNIDGISLNTQASAEVNPSGIYTRHQPTGIVKLFDGSNQLDSMDLSQRSTFVWDPSSFNEIEAGVKTLTVQYLGDQWNLPITTNTFKLVATTRRSSSMALTTTATTSTIYRPYGITRYKAETTSTYWNNKLINVFDGTTQIATAPVTGTTATFTIDSQSLSTGTHIIKTQYPQDFAYNEMFSNTLSLRILKTTLPITLTRNSATVLRPSTVTLTLASTASFYTAETVQIYDNGQPWFTATFSGTSTTITTSSSYFSTGTHIVKASIVEDDNYNAVESSTSSIFIDKSTIPLILDNSNPASTSTISIVPIGIVYEYEHNMLEFRPVNTATFLSNFTAQPLHGGNDPGPGGTAFNLYFNGGAVDDVMIGETPTYYQYYIENNRYFIQVWRINNITGEPDEYDGVSYNEKNPIFNKWMTYTTGTVVAELASISTAINTITRPANVTFNIRSTSTFNVPKVVKILDNGILFTSTTYTGTFTSITTSSSYIPVGSHNFQVAFDGDNDYYSSISLTRPLSIGKYQPGALTLITPSTTLTRPSTFVITATTTDSFYNGKSIILVNNNQNIGSMTFANGTTSTTISTSLLSVGANEITARFVETNDAYPTVSNTSTVTTVKQFGGKLLFQGPTTTATIYLPVDQIFGGGTRTQNNLFNVNATPTFTFTVTTTSTYFNGKTIGLYVENRIGSNLLGNTTINNGSGTFVISSTSSQFEIDNATSYGIYTYPNFIYVNYLGDADYTTSTANTILSPDEVHGIAPPYQNPPYIDDWTQADLAQTWKLDLYRP